jgi:hypothetical protein
MGGSSNMFDYVHNDPVNFVDPFGLTEEDVRQLIGIVAQTYPVIGNTAVGYADMGDTVGRSQLNPILPNKLLLASSNLGPLSSSQKERLLDTLFHEAQHLTNGFYREAYDDLFGAKSMIPELTQMHYDIYINAGKLTDKNVGKISGGRSCH